MTAEPIRLQKFLSQQGVCSRREAEDLMRRKKIKINNKIATLGDKVLGTEKIVINNKLLNPQKSPEKIYLKFHKPRDVECTLRKFSDHESLASFDFGPVRVFPVGRLDKDSRGLILLTNDGDITHKLMHPSFEHEKEYEVKIDHHIKKEDVEKLEQGIVLEEGKTAPCKIKIINSKKFTIILREGKKRQIRRMCESLGYEVLDLLRIRIKNIHLKNIPAGQTLPLSSVEKKELLSNLAISN